jgi:hypothetical protein
MVIQGDHTRGVPQLYSPDFEQELLDRKPGSITGDNQMKNSILLAMGICLLFPSLATAEPVPTWSDQINSPNRFKVLKEFNNEAVLDKETGLVWNSHRETQMETDSLMTAIGEIGLLLIAIALARLWAIAKDGGSPPFRNWQAS